MGAVQKLATVVIIGLVGLATLLVIYLADEPNRRAAEAREQEEVAIQRGIQTYTTYCVACHGPAGEGYAFKEPGRIGMPLGGRSDRLWVNQTDDPVAWEKQETIIRNAIVNGRGAMPVWGEENGGELNNEQIEELVLMIHKADWNEVYNHVIEANNGVYPVAEAPPSTQGDQANETGQQPGASGDTGAVTLEGYDIGWTQKEITVAPGGTINLVNSGAAAHNFDITDLGIVVDMPAGQTVPYTLPADIAPGTYEFICNIPGHAEAGMTGTLIVEGAPAAPAGQAPAPEASPAPGGGAAGAPAGGQIAEVTVEGFDIGWTQKEVTVTPGTTVQLVNTGAAGHNFE
ncbi:MAG: plastocyanin/azurin family copper-binding protein, partial [Chloroflexota bacterium]|nr:plastocyanin/azurin family copper-binding protein [Chloroflexota bacterium]